MKQLNYIFYTLLLIFNVLICKSQFHPQVGLPGTSAISKDSSIIKAWAVGCTVKRGYQDVTNTSLGYASAGDSSLAIGVADGSGVVSLGDGGEAILTFSSPIKNGSGPDFCVFENAFDSGFLELATVSVSSDGINFYEFLPTSNTQFTTQIGPFDAVLQADKLNNLAGKYIANYGTPFDLQELSSITTLNINSITHVKIKDVVGCINCNDKTIDKNLNPINEPFPTAFASSGFDLDAVGVINQTNVNLTKINEFKENILILNYKGGIKIINKTSAAVEIEIINSLGNIMYSFNMDKTDSFKFIALESDLYILKCQIEQNYLIKKIVIN